MHRGLNPQPGFQTLTLRTPETLSLSWCYTELGQGSAPGPIPSTRVPNSNPKDASNPQPDTLSPKPQPLSLKPQTLNTRPQTLHPKLKSQLLRPKPQILKPKPQPLSLKPQTLNTRPQTLHLKLKSQTFEAQTPNPKTQTPTSKP